MTQKTVTLASFSADSRYLAGAVRCYVETWKRDWEASYDFFSRYARYPDFYGLVALSDGEVIGSGFGTRSLPGQWWHDVVAAHVGAEHAALQDAWVLVELEVLKAYQGYGTGTRLHNALLAGQPCPRTLLSTEVANRGARRLYERLGWRYLHPGFRFNEGQEPYVVMHKELA
ncbi:MAG: GNAT family N-acetyltransferase [Ktedonobacteraceae bacterium]|nr:GNAT family N-acetyltransferase [Ktedonobacteraceae bacterium]